MVRRERRNVARTWSTVRSSRQPTNLRRRARRPSAAARPGRPSPTVSRRPSPSPGTGLRPADRPQRVRGGVAPVPKRSSSTSTTISVSASSLTSSGRVCVMSPRTLTVSRGHGEQRRTARTRFIAVRKGWDRRRRASLPGRAGGSSASGEVLGECAVGRRDRRARPAQHAPAPSSTGTNTSSGSG